MTTDHSTQGARLALLHRGRLGRYDLTSRMVMAPMTRNRAHADGVPSELMATYYSQRASAALIIAEATAISPRGVGSANMPGLFSRAQVEGWQRITSAVHAVDGRMFVQLFHAGRVSHPSLQPNEERPVAPSPIRPAGEIHTGDARRPYVTPRALIRSEIRDLISDFARASQLALAAGFDGVELHAANGYLLDQFLRAGTNHRGDDYGGSARNRARFLVEVTEAVVSICGADRVGVRLSPLHGFNDMSDAAPRETFGAAVELLNDLGLAYLHVVEDDNSPQAGPPFDLRELRRAWKSAYMANGSYDLARAEAAIREGVDFISFGKLFLANPDLPQRFAIGAPLNEPDRASFYGGDARGYTDYPLLPNV